jgi:hypothetical protein
LASSNVLSDLFLFVSKDEKPSSLFLRLGFSTTRGGTAILYSRFAGYMPLRHFPYSLSLFVVLFGHKPLSLSVRSVCVNGWGLSILKLNRKPNATDVSKSMPAS